MADHSGYTILTKYIPVEFFIDLIKSPIKKLIHKYGHKNCGLRHEELCEEIKKIISDNKKIELKHMDQAGKNKWNKEWSSQRNGFFNKLFEEEGFINMCYPPKKIGNPSLYQLKSKHIQFCKERDVRKAAVEKNNEYNECVRYNKWIIAETKELTLEFLRNVKISNLPTVKKYFSTKTQPEGYDPRDTYPQSKLDCTKYNPPTRSHPQMPLAKAPTNSLHPPTAHDVTQRSQGKDGSSLPDLGSKSDKTKTDENIPLTPKPSTTGSIMPPSTKTETNGASNAEQTNVIAKGPVPPIKGDKEKKEATPIQDEPPTDTLQTTRDQAHPKVKSPPLSSKDTSPTPATESVTAQTATTSLFSTPTTVINTTSSQTPVTPPSLTITSDLSANSGSPSPSDPLPPVVVTKDQYTPPQSTTTPVTSANIHSTETVPAPFAVPSLDQSQPPPESTPPAITALQEPGTPASSSASTFTNTVTSTTAAPAAVTIPTMSTTHEPISSAKEATSASSFQESPPTSAAVGPEATTSATARDPQQTVIPAHTSLSKIDTAKFSVQTKPDGDPGTKSAAVVLPKPKGPIKAADNQLSNDTQQTPGNHLKTQLMIPDSNVQGTPHNRVQPISPVAVQHPPYIGVVPSASDKSGASITAPKLNIKTTPKDDSTVRTNKNDNPSIIPEGIPPLTHIIPTLLIILGTLTLLFQLYKVK